MSSSYRGKVGTVKAGQSIAFALGVETPHGVIRDYTGATVEAWMRPVSSLDDAVEVTAELDANPGEPPQVIVSLDEAETAALTVPGQVNLDVTVRLSGSVVDKPTAYFDVVGPDVHAG